jgi:hypothetical protein
VWATTVGGRIPFIADPAKAALPHLPTTRVTTTRDFCDGAGNRKLGRCMAAQKREN